MEKTIIEEERFLELDDYFGEEVSAPLGSWAALAFVKSMDNRKPTRTRLRLTEWFEGAPFFPVIRQRAEPEWTPTQ